MKLREPEIIRALLRDRVRILSYLDSFANDFQLAEDCYQEICAAAVEKSDEFEDETHLLRWAMRAGRNKSIDTMRRRDRQPCLLSEEVLEQLEDRWMTESMAGLGDDGQRLEALRVCLSQLTENSRQMINLRYLDGLKSRRIAEMLGRKVETVYRTLTRALVSLRECMDSSANAVSTQPQPERP